jgi:hypothetical protein
MCRFGALALLAALTRDVAFGKDETQSLRNSRRLSECGGVEFSSGVYQVRYVGFWPDTRNSFLTSQNS